MTFRSSANSRPSFSPSSAALWVPGFNALMCSHYNRYGSHSKLVTLTAGFVSGFVAMEVQPQQPLRQRVLMYMLNVGTESLYRLLASAGLVKLIPKGECLVFTLAAAYLSYVNLRHPEQLANLVKRPLTALEGQPECEKPLTFVHPKVDAILKIPTEFAASPVGYIAAGSVRALLIGLALKAVGAVLGLVGALVQKLKEAKAQRLAAELALSPNSARFPPILPKTTALAKYPGFLDKYGFILFLVSSTTLYRTARQIIRMPILKDCKLAAALPGLALGVSSFFWPSVLLSQLMLSQSLESSYNIVISKGLVIPPTKGASILFGLCTALVFYAATFDKKAVRPSTLNLLNKLSNGNFASLPKIGALTE